MVQAEHINKQRGTPFCCGTVVTVINATQVLGLELFSASDVGKCTDVTKNALPHPTDGAALRAWPS